MTKNLCLLLCAALLAGCAALNRSSKKQEETVELPSRGEDSSQVYSLPGVPMKYMPPQGWAKSKPAEEKPATAPKAEKPAEPAAAQPAPPPEPVRPAAAAPADSGDLEFHLNAARRYAAQKKYRSAAAEYGASLPFLPAGDARAVHLLERQGAMHLRAGGNAKAEELFRAAIKRAGELKYAGEDLANAHLGLGYCLEVKKSLPEALKNYEAARDLTRSPKIKARVIKTIADLKAAGK